MAFEKRHTTDLVQIAAAGGGFRLNAASRHTADLVQIAAAAGRSGARLTFLGLGSRQQVDLVQIASAGKGAVCFED